MSKTLNILKEINRLNNLIEVYNYYYFVRNEPLVSDYYFDYLYEKLKKLENEYPDLRLPKSQTNIIAPLDSSVPEKELYSHKVKMYSLNKSYTDHELSAFMISVKKLKKEATFICEEKIDGISLSLVYQNGLLEKCVTRGNGEKGIVVNNVINKTNFLPKRIETYYPYVEIRGELFIKKSELVAFNETNAKYEYVNTRNCVAGLISRKEKFECKLNFFAYSVAYPYNLFGITQEESLNNLRRLGFNVNKNFCLISQLSQFQDYYKKTLNSLNTKNYDLDGVVIKVNDLSFQQKLGFTDKYPKFAIAYKFPNFAKETILNKIITTVSRYGVITPVGVFDSVEINNVNISKATLSNFKKIKKLDIRIGDTIIVERSGDVIPSVTGVNKTLRPSTAKPYDIPKYCPTCQSPLFFSNSLSNAYCINSNRCESQIEQMIIHFCSKDAFNLQGFGESKIKQLYKEKIISDVLDLLYLPKQSNIRSKIINLQGWGEISCERLLKSIQESKFIELNNFIYGLNIPSIGKSKSKQLASFIKTAQRLKYVFNHFTYETMITIKTGSGIGQSNLESIKIFLNKKKIYSYLTG